MKNLNATKTIEESLYIVDTEEFIGAVERP